MVMPKSRGAAAAAVLLQLLNFAAAFDRDGCTSIAVSSGASEDGSVMASHANDCADCDWRIVYVPARDYPKGSMRTIHDATVSQYPRNIYKSRSPQYFPDMGIENLTVLGEIPQVEHTYAMWEGNYGLMNEHGLGMGESTCSSWSVGVSVKDGGDAIFTIGNLMAVALERCKTARCAIQTMGDLGSKYGFYGEDPGIGGSGEAVTIVDKTGEAWVFHMAGGVPMNKSKTGNYKGMRGALWAAQKVPEGHIAIMANSFIIRGIDPNDTANFMFHPGLFEMTQDGGWWNGVGEFDWMKILQPDQATFEYFPGYPPIPMYSTLRMWGVYQKAAPSLKIEITQDLYLYPFSIPVDKKLSVEDVMDLFRTHYEGTPFDMTLGSLAGPWGTPNRAEGGWGQVVVKGQFARSTSIPRTSYTQVVQSGKIKEPITWFAPDASASSVFVPFFTSVLSHADGKYDDEAFGSGTAKTFPFFAGENGGKLPPAWWAFDFVANWMDLNYNNMSKTYVYPLMHKTQKEVIAEALKAVKKAEKKESEKEAAEYLAEVHSGIQRRITKQWWKLAEMLVVRYNDQFFNWPDSDPRNVHSLGYPAFWLQQLGYDQQFYYPNWLGKAATPPPLLPPEDLVIVGFANMTNLTNASGTPKPTTLAAVMDGPASSFLPVVLAAFASLSMGLVMGHFVGYRQGVRAASDEGGFVKMSA